MILRHLRSGNTLEGRIEPGRHARIPQWRLQDDASLVRADTPAQLVELVFESGPLDPGRYEVDVIVAWRPRISAVIFVDGLTSRIESLGS
jgi:hypothetical protein